MRRVLVTGATGLLGSAICPALATGRCEIVRHGYSSAADVKGDLRIAEETRRILQETNPDIVLNLAALADVDACETSPREAFETNVRIVANLVQWRHGRTNPPSLVHISTDQIYDGPGPHREDDARPANVYALSKYCSELVALTGDATVLRTNFVTLAGRPSRNLCDWLVANLKAGKPIQLFTDVLFSPLSAMSLGEMLLRVFDSPSPGIFNLGSRGGMSKRDFAHLFARQMGLGVDCAQDSVSSEGGLRAYRPRDMRMDSSLFEKTYNVRLPDLKEEVKRLGTHA